ncbi:MAG: DUF4124 domain-containing protein [Sulfuricella sp.]|nr:DUF4124 domain-containing protein [Sulfuricella sp.]
MYVRLGLLLFGSLIALSAHAEIYKHVDEEGRVTYSNIPSKGAKKLNLDPIPVSPAAKPKVSAPSPAGFPKVDSDTQKKRDDMRHKILGDELATEEKLLTEAKQTLAEAENTQASRDPRNLPPKFLERLRQLKENVSLHEKNILALKIEIANLKR